MAQSAADLAVEPPTANVERATGARRNPTDDVTAQRARAAQTIQVASLFSPPWPLHSLMVS